MPTTPDKKQSGKVNFPGVDPSKSTGSFPTDQKPYEDFPKGEDEYPNAPSPSCENPKVTETKE